MDKRHKIPATVFTGFLGSGKTTIISNLIDELLGQKIRVAYVKNEIGNTDIDGTLIRGKHIETKELLSGCICCTLTGPFYHAMSELVDSIHPDRILIEASGVADPATVALMLSSHPKVFRDGVIAVIDVVHFEGYKDLSLTARRQAEFTDIIIFNKIETVDLQKKRSVVGYVRELNDSSPIIEAPFGYVDPSLVFGLDSKELDNNLQADPANHDMDCHGSTHVHDEHIYTFTLDCRKMIEKEKFLIFLSSFAPNVIRVKGFVNISGTWILVNRVGTRNSLTDMQPIENQKGMLVCIGFDIMDMQQSLQKKLNELMGADHG